MHSPLIPHCTAHWRSFSMSFWGQSFFQNDRDLDIAYTLSQRIRVDDLLTPDDSVRLRNELDSGKPDAEFHNLSDGDFSPDADLSFWGVKTAIVVFAAAAMRHGATISDEYRKYIKAAVKSRLGMYDTAKKEMATAIDLYQNGVPLDTSGKCLDQVAEEATHPPNRFGVVGLSLLDPSLFTRINTIKDKYNACEKYDENFLRCGRCHQARYCNAECQKKA